MGMSPRLLRPRASGSFKPDSISGIVHWWDANDASTVTLSSGAVSEWKSKAGTLTTASQTTANNRPTTTTVNGKTAILFDGENDGLNFTGTSRTDESWFVATAQLSAQSGQRQILSDGGAGTGISATQAVNKLLEVAFGGFDEGTHRLRSTHENGTVALRPTVISVVRSAAAGGFVFDSGIAQASAVNGATSFTSSLADTMSKIGYYSSSLFQFHGWIGEILLYDRALASDERAKVERYLGKKWGITVA